MIDAQGEFPTPLQRERATDRMELYSKKVDTLFSLMDQGRLSRESVRNTLIAELTASGAREDRAKDSSKTDGMTRLLNKKGFDEAYTQTVERLKPYVGTEAEEHAVVLNIDLNDLKVVNDEQGHEAGNQMLITFAQILRTVSRDTDEFCVTARQGGDEFILLLPNSDQAGAIAWWNRMLPALEAAGLRASVGSADIDPNNPERSLQEADDAMYDAKSRKPELIDGKMTSHYTQMKVVDGKPTPMAVERKMNG